MDEYGRECGNMHREGFICTRRWQHHGDHIAHTHEGLAVKRWRGGRSNWTREKVN